jgi:hypothetical protein
VGVDSANNVFARGKFWERRQKERESNEEFIRAIYQLGESCGYGKALPEHFRDKLCHGMTDREIAAELRSNSLNVECVLRSLRCREAMAKDQREERTRAQENLKSAQADIKNESGDVDAIHRKKSWHCRGDRDRNPDPDCDSEQDESEGKPHSKSQRPTSKQDCPCKSNEVEVLWRITTIRDPQLSSQRSKVIKQDMINI